MNQIGSIAALYRSTWIDCLRLGLASSVILSAVGVLLLPLRDHLLDSLLGAFLPADWLTSIQMANEALFHQIGGVLLFQTVAIICFSAVSVLFFPFRDRISIKAEHYLKGESVSGQGLHRELWYEAGLLLIAFNMYSAVYLLAYVVGESVFAYIDLLAFALLTVFFVLDLLSPAHFRRGLNCLYVVAALKRLPLKMLLFGLIFCAPIYALELFLGELVYQQEDDLVLAVALVAIIVVNCAVCSFALPAGTWLALDAIEALPGKSDGRWAGAWHGVFFWVQLVFAAMLFLFYASVVGVVLSKVPLKTANYDIEWLTLEYEGGRGGAPPSLRFDILIENQHPSLGLQVEDADLLLNLEGRYLGEVGLNIPYVAPMSSALVPVELNLRVDFSEFAEVAWQELIAYFGGAPPRWREKLQARLDVQLPLGLKLPIYIPQGYPHDFEAP